MKSQIEHPSKEGLFLPVAVLVVCIVWSAGGPSRAVRGQVASHEKVPGLPSHASKISLFDGNSLGQWKQSEFSKSGRVSVQNGTILLAQGKNLTGVTWTGPVYRMNYEISLQAKRVNGSDFFCGLTFPVGEDYCSLICGGWGGVLVGISSIDFRDADDNETGVGYDFERDQWYRIRVRVTTDLLEAWIDDDQVVELETADRLLTVRDEVYNSRPLGIATWRTTGALRNIMLEKIDALPRFVPTADYLPCTIEGWQVMVSPRLLKARPDLARQSRALLTQQLHRISNVLPEGLLKHMQRTVIWLELRDRHYEQTCYHPDREWLMKHGYNPEKAGGVEIADAEGFLSWHHERPYALLHELSHAYHHRVIGHDNQAIRTAFRQAKASAHYDQVRHISGEVRRHPAKNSAMEYFARGMEAFYGRSSYYPFDRQELQRVDPDLYSVIASLVQ